MNRSNSWSRVCLCWLPERRGSIFCIPPICYQNVMLVPFVFTCFLDIFFKLQALLSTILTDSQTPLEVLVLTAISLGLVFVGVCNEEIVVQSIIFVLMDRSEADDAEPIIRMLPVALGLLYLGKQVCFFPW
jgi:hypothetical protein